MVREITVTVTAVMKYGMSSSLSSTKGWPYGVKTTFAAMPIIIQESCTVAALDTQQHSTAQAVGGTAHISLERPHSVVNNQLQHEVGHVLHKHGAD